MDIFIDLIPLKARRWVYGILALAAALYGVYEAVNHDWRQFAVSVITALVGALAHANTKAPAPVQDVIDSVSGQAPVDVPPAG